MKLFASIVLFGLTATSGYSASFDCNLSSTRIEKLICSHQELSDLDSKLSEEYKATRNALSPDIVPTLLEEQKEWLKQTRNRCKDVSCLKTAYLSRIDRLITYRHPDKDLNDVEVNTENGAAILLGNSNYRNESFNSDISSHGAKGKISLCKMLIDVPVGLARSNHSFGAICTLTENNNTSEIMICNDEMIGHFKMDKISKEVGKQELVNFIVSNCYGG